MANVILTASAGIAVKQTAGDAGQKYFAAVFIFDFIQAAFSTAITQRFPFIDRHLGKRFFLPKFCAKAAEDNGLVIRPLGGNRVAVCPPLIIETTHVDELIEKFGAALNLTLDWVTAEKLA